MLRIILVTFNDEWDSWLFGCHFINNCARTKMKCVLEWWGVGLYNTSIKSDIKHSWKNDAPS